MRIQPNLRMMPILAIALAGCPEPIDDNEAPGVRFIDIRNGDQINEGVPVTFNLLVEDRDGDNDLTLVLTSTTVDAEGNPDPSSERLLDTFADLDNGTTVSSGPHALEGGAQLITATVADADVDNPRVVSLNLLMNRKPTEPGVTAEYIAQAQDRIRCAFTGIATDPDYPDDNRLLYEYHYRPEGADEDDPRRVPPTQVPIGVTLPFEFNIPGTSFNVNETWECCVTAYEAAFNSEGAPVKAEDGLSTEGCASAVVGNTKPNPPSVQTYPAKNNNKVWPYEPLVCVASGLGDPDGDAVTTRYSWEIDSGSGFVAAGVNDAPLPPSATSPGDEVRCVSVASDGKEDSEATNSPSIVVRDGLVSENAATIRYTSNTASPMPWAVSVIDRDENGQYLPHVVFGNANDELVQVVRYFDPQSIITSGDINETVTFDAESRALANGDYVARPGDFDDDGRRDLAFTDDSTSTVYVIAADQSACGFDLLCPTQVHIEFQGTTGFGQGLALSSFNNGLTSGSIAIGDPANERVLLWFTASPGVYSTSSAELTLSVSEANFGRIVTTGGDYNGDGLEDMAVASDGAVHLFYSGANLVPTAPNKTFRFSTQGAARPLDVVFVPDVNGDGNDELAISFEGQGVGLFRGNTSTTTNQTFAAADVRMTHPDDSFGANLAALTDVGLPSVPSRLVVGSPDTGNGTVFVFDVSTLPSTPLLDSDALFRVTGSANAGQLTTANYAGPISPVTPTSIGVEFGELLLMRTESSQTGEPHALVFGSY